MHADRYISSLPRVGVVIPNPSIYLLPEFQDLAAGLSTTLSLPNLLPHGAYATPTSDGFLIYLPSSKPCVLMQEEPLSGSEVLSDHSVSAGSGLWLCGRVQRMHMSHDMSNATAQPLVTVLSPAVARSPAQRHLQLWHPVLHPDWRGLWLGEPTVTYKNLSCCTVPYKTPCLILCMLWWTSRMRMSSYVIGHRRTSVTGR